MPAYTFYPRFYQGTQANLVGLGWMLSPIGAVVAADTGHINVYEAGAIEATGHKVCTVPHRLGKLDLDAMEKLVECHQQEEFVTPEVVFLSQSSELGTIYRKSELEGIRAFCDRWNLLLFIDGARIGVCRYFRFVRRPGDGYCRPGRRIFYRRHKKRRIVW